MKKNDLVRTIKANGAILVRNGAKHDWYKNFQTGVAQAVPRHNEINEMLAKSIIKRLSNH